MLKPAPRRDRPSRDRGAARLLVLLLLAAFAGPACGQAIHAPLQMSADEGTYTWPIDCFLPLGESPEQYPVDAPERSLLRFADLYSGGRYHEALEAALRLSDAVPDRPEGHYNAACALARLNRRDEALRALERAIDCGFRSTYQLRMDPSLSSIRHEGRFGELYQRAEQLAAAERPRACALRRASVAEVVGAIESAAPVMLDRYHVPGMAIGLVREGELVWSSAFGVTDERAGIAIETDHLFALAAPVRLISLMAAVQVDRRSELDLDHLLVELVHMEQQSQRRNETEVVFTRYVEGPTVRAASHALVTVVMQSEVERHARLAFEPYCQERLFAPLSLEHTWFRAPEDIGERVVRGHNRLGTPYPLDVGPSRSGVRLFTTVLDLARLVEAAVAGETRVPEIDRAIFARVDRGTEELWLELRSGIEVRRTPYGTRVRIEGVEGGVGCLMQWYPATRNGIVVLFNAETGVEPARRLAHLALGGEG